MTKSQKIIEKQKKYIFDAVKNYYEEPIVVSNAKGSIVKDLDGKSYLDFFGGILTVSIGHANEEVNTAVKTQINHLTHISSLYPSVPVVDLAERLVKLAPQNLEKVFLNATGTEADETAVMLAQLYTGNSEILATPTLLAMNNKQAEILVGSNIPIVTGKYLPIELDSASICINFDSLLIFSYE